MTGLEALGFWWAKTILPWAIDSTLVALLLVVLVVLARNATPSFRKAVATLGLAKMAIPPILLPIGLLSLGVANPAGSSPAPLGAPLAGRVVGVLGVVHLLGFAIGLVLVARRARELHRLLDSARPITQPAVLEAFSELSKSLGLWRTPRLVASSVADVPFATGLRSPTIVLPNDLAEMSPSSELRGILAHELGHIRKGDLWFAWLRALVGAFWWPSPIARYLGRLQEAAAEELCDDLVVEGGLAPAREYARGLVAAAAVACQPHRRLAAAAVGASDLERRILRLASPTSTRSRRFSVASLALLGLILMPPSSTGQISPIGWTTRVLFAHPSSPAITGDAATEHGHRHQH